MASITTRAGKGAPLTNAELDANFTNINSELATAAITGGTINGATIGASSPSTGSFTQLDVDNVRVNGNTISNTAANTSITILPNGTGVLDVNSVTAVKLPAGTQAQRPTPAAGMLRFNEDVNEFEGYNGTEWSSVGGSAISNDTTTTTDLFPTFVDATTGTAADIFTSNDKLLYKPSTGEFKSPALVATNGIVLNAQVISENSVIPAGFNAGSVGPVEIAAGVDVDIADGSEWYIA